MNGLFNYEEDRKFSFGAVKGISFICWTRRSGVVGRLVVFALMAVQDQCGENGSNAVLSAGNVISLNSGQLEQFACGNDYSPKVRKPYTITKQRERWTEDEHKKFLEALKLYGRAWRRIEEHIGTKTAVQIRSHAQKFFSKVVREASASKTSASDPIEIPPPRPKRKPVHPYPRKMSHPLNKELPIPEQPLRSSSPNFSFSEQENQSPTSVLSAVGSDTLGSADINTPNCSLSPVSCAGGSHHFDFAICEPNLTPEDDGSPSTAPVNATIHVEQSPKVQKLDLFPKGNASSEECLVEETSTWSLRLFGRTVLVTERHKPPSPTILNSTLLQLDTNNDGKSVQQLPFPLLPFQKMEPIKVHLDFNGDEIQDKEIQKEGSWTGSNSGSVNEEENVDKNLDSKTHVCSRKKSCTQFLSLDQMKN